jgi:hypothetical protein
MQPSTLTRREYKGKIYVKNIIEIRGGSETGSGSGTYWKVGSGSEKNIQDPQTADKVKEENSGLYFLRV